MKKADIKTYKHNTLTAKRHTYMQIFARSLNRKELQTDRKKTVYIYINRKLLHKIRSNTTVQKYK